MNRFSGRVDISHTTLRTKKKKNQCLPLLRVLLVSSNVFRRCFEIDLVEPSACLNDHRVEVFPYSAHRCAYTHTRMHPLVRVLIWLIALCTPASRVSEDAGERWSSLRAADRARGGREGFYHYYTAPSLIIIMTREEAAEMLKQTPVARPRTKNIYKRNVFAPNLING